MEDAAEVADAPDAGNDVGAAEQDTAGDGAGAVKTEEAKEPTASAPSAAAPSAPASPSAAKKEKSVFAGLGGVLLGAIKENDWSRAQGMIMGGVELTETDSRGQTALHAACWKGAVGVVRLLLENSVPIDAVDDIYGVTALHVACSRKTDLIVRQLIDAKAKLNIVGIEGDTPLSRAAGRGSLDVCRRLLVANAQPDPDPVEAAVLDSPARSPIAIATVHSPSPGRSPCSHRSFSPNRMGSPSPDRLVQQPPISALLKACKRNAKYEVVKLLCEERALLNAVDNKGNTALHISSFHGNPNMVKVLLKRNADVDMTNSQGRIPLHYAARGGDLRVIKMLVEFNSNINCEDQDQVTPLMCCGDPCGRKALEKLGAKDSEHWAQISPPVSPKRHRSPCQSRSLSPLRGRSESPRKGK